MAGDRAFTSFDFDHDDGLRTLLMGQRRGPDRPFEIVGINRYTTPVSELSACVADAKAMTDLLARHHDGDRNFDCVTLTSPAEDVTKALLREHLQELFHSPADLALFYFSGHGALTPS